MEKRTINRGEKVKMNEKKIFAGKEFEIGKNFAEVLMEDGIVDTIEFYILPKGWDDNTDNLDGVEITNIAYNKRIRLDVSAIYQSGSGGKSTLNIELMTKEPISKEMEEEKETKEETEEIDLTSYYVDKIAGVIEETEESEKEEEKQLRERIKNDEKMFADTTILAVELTMNSYKDLKWDYLLDQLELYRIECGEETLLKLLFAGLDNLFNIKK